MYKKVITKRGQELWYKDGKMTSKKYVPIEEIEKQEVKDTLVNNGVQPEPQEEPQVTGPRGCIICGGPAEYQRFATIDGEAVTIKLCGDCYYTRTLGEMVGKIKKEKNDGRK